jgi:exopolysaccharide biosynthesis polyprenyl glycosylphosphotransferase
MLVYVEMKKVDSSVRRALDGAPDLTLLSPVDAPSGQHARATPARRRASHERDVRVRAELAYRRKMVALLRQTGRVVSLHILDASVLWLAAVLVAALGGSGLERAATSIGLIIVSLIALNTQAAYRPGPGRREFRRLVLGMAVAGLVVLFTPLLTGETAVPTATVLGFVVVGSILLGLERMAVDTLLRRIYARGIGLRRAVILAPADVAIALMHDLDSAENPDQQVVGYLTPDPTADSRALGSLDDLASVLDELDVREVLLPWPATSEVVERTTTACFERGVVVLMMPWAGDHLHGWAEPVRIGSAIGYQLHPSRLRMPVLAVKRILDVLLAGLGVLLTLPLMGLIAVAIKLDSRGPVFFKQWRVGVGGSDFLMWKFRSMALGSDERKEELAHMNQYPSRNLFKLKDDPRITRVGRILRRFSLDELPQLFNIIRGDMSLVGPRPPLRKEVAEYAPHHHIRLSVVPGLTGPWQVGGRNLISDFEEVVRLERRYIERWTLGRDVKILLQTIGVVLTGRGAY